MSKIKKTLVKGAFALAVGLACFSHQATTHAYEGEGPSDPSRIETWKQWDYKNISQDRIVPGGDTVGDSSCGYWSLLAATMKNNPDTELTPEAFLNKVYYSNTHDTAWGHLNFKNVSNLGTDLELATQEEMDAYSVNIQNGYFYRTSNNLSYTEKIDKLKELTKAGYYVIACFQATPQTGHYIFLDYVDEHSGDVRIFDSGFKGTWLSTFYTDHKKPLLYFIVLKGKDMDLKHSLYSDSNAKVVNDNLDLNKALKESEKLTPILPLTVVK